MSKILYIAQAREMPLLKDPILAILAKNRVAKVEIKSSTSKTNHQLGYYHAVVLPYILQAFVDAGNDTWTIYDIDQYLKSLFFYDEKVINGQVIKIIKSKETASIEEFSEYLKKVLRWCNENAIFIPEPMH